MRARLPPSARRIAISFRRDVPRASSMFARFKQATSKTTPAMPVRSAPMATIGPVSPGLVLVSNARSGAVMNVWFFCSTGKAASRLAARPLSAGSAAAAESPGFSRPTTINFSRRRSESVSVRRPVESLEISS